MNSTQAANLKGLVSGLTLNPFASKTPQDHYLYQKLDNVPTPAMVIDKTVFERNCKRMKQRREALGWEFRTHVKTHKTSEGTRIQCEALGRLHPRRAITLKPADRSEDHLLDFARDLESLRSQVGGRRRRQ
jgi:hypothetical protein